MGKLHYVTFVKDEFQLIAALFALRSLQRLEICSQPPMVFVPKALLEETEAKFPKFNVKNVIRKLGGDFKEAFSKGYNPRNSLRVTLSNIARKLDADEMLYFAPNTIFFNNVAAQMTVADVTAARAQDNYWPQKELYGSSLESIWEKIIAFSGGKTEDWIDASIPKEYWRRYPTVSSQLIFARNPKDFSDGHMENSKALIEAKHPELEGQGRDLVVPTLAMSVIKSAGKIIDLNWDQDLVAYDNFIQLILRLRGKNAEIFKDEFLDQPVLRSLLKRMHDYRYYFYHNALVNVRDHFDETEAAFPAMRMDLLIERRKVDRKIKALIREGKKAEAEVLNGLEKGEKLSEERDEAQKKPKAEKQKKPKADRPEKANKDKKEKSTQDELAKTLDGDDI